jgi:hypothetical protein
MDQISQDHQPEDGTDEAEAKRNESRDSLLLVSQFRVDGQEGSVPVRIRNLSAGGLMAELAVEVEVGTPVEIEVRGVGWVTGRIAWVAAGRCGVAFDHLIDPQAARKPVVAAKVETPPAKPIKSLF